MDDNVIKIQMKNDNLAVNYPKIPSIDDILSKQKNINNKHNNSNENNTQIKLENNETVNKENKAEKKKNNSIDIFLIIIHALYCAGISLDFINYLISRHVRIIYII